MKKNVFCLVIICVLVLGQAAAAQQIKKVGFAQANINPRNFTRGPDLAVTQLLVYPPTRASKGYHMFKAVVKNIGSTYIPATRAFIRVGGESRPREYLIPALRPGASKTISRSARLTRPRVYRVTVKADSKYQVREINERNNEQYKNFTVRRSASTPIMASQVINSNIGSQVYDPIIPLRVTGVSLYYANQSLVPHENCKGKVLFIVSFNKAVLQSSLVVGSTIKVDVKNTSSGQTRLNIGGYFRVSANLRQLVFVSHQDVGHLLNIGGGDNLEFKITLIGTDSGADVVKDSRHLQALDGDSNGQAGGNFVSAHPIVT